MNKLKNYCKILAPLHFIGTCFFVLHPYFMISAMNWTTSVIPLQPHPLPTERFWSLMAGTMEFMLTLCYILAIIDIIKYFEVFKLVLIGKFFTTVQFLLCFIFEKATFAYLIGFITDGFLFASILYLYINAKREIKSD